MGEDTFLLLIRLVVSSRGWCFCQNIQEYLCAYMSRRNWPSYQLTSTRDLKTLGRLSIGKIRSNMSRLSGEYLNVLSMGQGYSGRRPLLRSVLMLDEGLLRLGNTRYSEAPTGGCERQCVQRDQHNVHITINNLNYTPSDNKAIDMPVRWFTLSGLVLNFLIFVGDTPRMIRTSTQSWTSIHRSLRTVWI